MEILTNYFFNLLFFITKRNKDKFKQRDFYRLQQIEYLYKTRLIDENLMFL